MATILAKTYVQPIVSNHRLTAFGHKYDVRTTDFTDVVTLSGNHAACTCQYQECEHIRAVRRQRALDSEQAKRRELLQFTFDLSYGAY